VAISKRTAKLLEKKYGQKKGFEVGSPNQIAKGIKGTLIPKYLSKGGKVVKKKNKKIVKKTKNYKKK
jgi:hypothetical protein|tara:strand:- start:444 stop:644 length:201 start_codon:yes stop_codon:yes gene_type:complete